MGVYIGRETLVVKKEQLKKISPNEFKGLIGEIEVGDLLAKYLPDDT